MNSGAKVIFFTRNITDVFLYHELSNYRISFHTDVRGISRMFFFITNYRIIEFLFIRMSAEYHGCFLYHELSNYRIHDKIYKSVMLRDNPCEEDNSQIR